MSEFNQCQVTLESHDQLIVTIPRGGFDEIQIRNLREEVLHRASAWDTWVLLECPKDKAGLTPEAVDEIAQSYDIFHQHGCIAIGLEVGSTFGSIFKKSPFTDLSIPMYINKEKEKVLHQLKAHLNRT